MDVIERTRLDLQGPVQGVGFRPFVFRLASELHLKGWVANTISGASIEIEGLPDKINEFRSRLNSERPAHAVYYSIESVCLKPTGATEFKIVESVSGGQKIAVILPDIATCDECLRELFDDHDRRYRYPFINCTHCGPRFSLIESLPYDRPRTTMKRFKLCRLCQDEYGNPADRRFHAQPNACPRCGPQLFLWDPTGRVLASREKALQRAVREILNGRIVAVKGLGGFHLMADATQDSVVRTLRERKHRWEKPLAVMMRDLEQARHFVKIDEVEGRLLTSSAAPIVLLEKNSGGLSESLAPLNPDLGVMLAYTPLHHLLLKAAGRPLVATSGNLADEPIVTDEEQALSRLSGIADLFLVHDRPIARSMDDSVLRVILGREMMLRRARGYAPLPLRVAAAEQSILSTGAHLKNTVCQSFGEWAFVSQHIGDLENAVSVKAFERAAKTFEGLMERKPDLLACDEHPDYHSSRYAAEQGKPVIRVQHHYAHVMACLTDNEAQVPALGVAWDGSGAGPDGTLWGGEFLAVTDDGWDRVACLRPFSLPGGEAAIREPRRSAFGILHEIDALDLFTFKVQERSVWSTILSRKINSPRTSSAGRLFDAMAALLGVRQERGFEGQAAMELEFIAHGIFYANPYPYNVVEENGAGRELLYVDWEPMIRAALRDVRDGTKVGMISARFHQTLIEMILEIARRQLQKTVVLSGGCFQNKRLLEGAVLRLRQEGFLPLWPQRLPPNDGAISLGQTAAAALTLHRKTREKEMRRCV